MDDALLTQHSIGVKAEKVVVAFIFGSLPDHPPSFFQYIFSFVLGLKPKASGILKYMHYHQVPTPAPTQEDFPWGLLKPSKDVLIGHKETKVESLGCSRESSQC